MPNLRKRGLHYKPPVKKGEGAKLVKRRKLRGRLARLWVEYHGICALCGNRIMPMAAASIDHIIPLSRGGTNHNRNLQLAHAVCNQRKGNAVVHDGDEDLRMDYEPEGEK